MKFYQLEVGQVFWYMGHKYFKTSEAGARPNGEQKEIRIPPHTVVERAPK